MRLHQDGLKGKDLLGSRLALARRQLHLHARLGHVPSPDARPQLEIKLAGNDANFHGDVVFLVEGEGLFEPLLEPILLDAFLTVFHPARHVADQVCDDELDGEDDMLLHRKGRSRVSLRHWPCHAGVANCLAVIMISGMVCATVIIMNHSISTRPR